MGAGADQCDQGQGEAAQVHPGPTDHQQGASLHQPILSGLQELCLQHSGASFRTAALASPLGVTQTVPQTYHSLIPPLPDSSLKRSQTQTVPQKYHSLIPRQSEDPTINSSHYHTQPQKSLRSHSRASLRSPASTV